jgi:hypothetical protein
VFAGMKTMFAGVESVSWTVVKRVMERHECVTERLGRVLFGLKPCYAGAKPCYGRSMQGFCKSLMRRRMERGNATGWRYREQGAVSINLRGAQILDRSPEVSLVPRSIPCYRLASLRDTRQIRLRLPTENSEEPLKFTSPCSPWLTVAFYAAAGFAIAITPRASNSSASVL